MAYLGYPGNAARCTFAVGEPIFAPLAGEWTHFAWSYDGTSMKAYVDGTLAQQDDVTAGGAIVYPPSDYESSQGGWVTIGAYHDTNGECACTVPPICAFSKPQKCCTHRVLLLPRRRRRAQGLARCHGAQPWLRNGLQYVI